MKRKSFLGLVILLFLIVSTVSFGEEMGSRLFSFNVHPMMDFGLKQKPVFPGYGLKASVEYWLPYIPLSVFGSFVTIQQLLDYMYRISESPLFYIQGNGGVLMDSLDNPTDVNAYFLAAGIGVNIPIIELLSIKGQAEAGYLFTDNWTYQSTDMSGLYFGGQAGLQFSPFPLLSIGIGGRYTYKTDTSDADNPFQSIGAFAEVSIHIQGPKREIPDLDIAPGTSFMTHTTYIISEKDGKEVREEAEVGESLGFKSIEMHNIFPVLFKYYEKSSFGNVIVINETEKTATDIAVSFYIDEYMSDPWLCAEIAELPPGEEAAVDLYALFTKDILEITERTKVSSKVIIDFNINNQRIASERVEPIRLERRSALTWDDDRKAAAYITAGDPTVLMFSNNVSSGIKNRISSSLNKNFALALAMYEAIRLHGISYIIDPTTPYETLSKDRSAIDFLKFPRETLAYLAGDCDDLSILYCSLLESIGIETAFITIPGHIFMAFSLGISAERARRDFLDPDAFIYQKDLAWVPVEITMVDDSFLDAWQEGAREWREFSGLGEARFYPNHDSWKEYEPVQLPGQSTPIAPPDKTALVEVFSSELDRFINKELYSRVTALEEKIRQSNNDPRYINRLGTLYAKYGLFDKAIEHYNTILQDREYIPALVNMGNISYLQEDRPAALGYYERAYELSPNNPHILLNLTRIHNVMENYGMSKGYFAQLEEVDPQLAEQYAFLSMRAGEGGRAAEAGAGELILWADEEE